MSQLGISLPDRYKLGGPVASGGMAAVYSAHDTLLGRDVAVKVLAEHLNEDVAARERFQREARAAANLSSHPGVVTIFDVGEHQGRSFIVMELFRGGTIADVLRSGKRTEFPQTCRWLERAAEALDAAHENGIIHRDIKPANLLLDERGNLAVADFGIARLAWEDAVTQTGQVLGTAAYISPEQAEGGTATAASDRYALACVAYELVTGTRPFDGEHFAAQARAHIEDEPTPPTVRDPSLPKAVDAVFARGLAKDPSARWPSAVAFVQALEDALEGPAPTVAAVPAPETTQVMTGGRFGSPSGHRAAPPAPRDPGKRLLPMLALGLLAVAIVAIVLAAGNGGGNGGGEAANDDPAPAAENEPATKKKPKKKPAAPAAATETAEPQATEEPAAEEPATEETPSGTPTQLNDRGWQLYLAGSYAESVPYFRGAVEGCGNSGELVCQYALYNLGSSLHRSGNSAEGIPYLKKRYQKYPDNQPGAVRQEIEAACAAAGEGCGFLKKG